MPITYPANDPGSRPSGNSWHVAPADERLPGQLALCGLTNQRYNRPENGHDRNMTDGRGTWSPDGRSKRTWFWYAALFCAIGIAFYVVNRLLFGQQNAIWLPVGVFELTALFSLVQFARAES